MRPICKFFSVAVTVILFNLPVTGQNSNSTSKDLVWSENVAYDIGYTFKNAVFQPVEDRIIPLYFEKLPIQTNNANVRLANISTEAFKGNQTGLGDILGQDFKVTSHVRSERGKYFLAVVIVPLRYNGGVESLTHFDLIVEPFNDNSSDRTNRLKKKGAFKTGSVLSSGTWYKLSTDREGIYEITKSFLESKSINASSFSLSTLKLYGNGGGLLPEVIANERIDDLEEIPLRVVDNNGNDRLDNGDRVYFYAQGATVWKFDNGAKYFTHENHIYDSKNFYYLTFGGSEGKRVEIAPDRSGSVYDITIEDYEVMLLHEQDELNFIESGREWFGNSFRFEPVFTKSYSISNAVDDIPVRFRYKVAARSTSNSTMSIRNNGGPITNVNFSFVTGSYEGRYADVPNAKVTTFNTSGGNINLQFQYFGTSPEADAWIDYYELAVRRKMVFTEGQYMVFVPQIAGKPTARFVMETTNHQLWDVTNHNDVFIQSWSERNGKKEFITLNPERQGRRYCAFDGISAFSPEYVGKLTNQNLHGLSPVDYVMIVHPSLLSQAERLAEFHRDVYGSSVSIATTSQIYNEFSSGKEDATALRDFIRMMYVRGMDQGTPLKNVLLFGDGSYDYKDRINNNTNLVPTYQSPNSYYPTASYGSDNYFVILEEDEGRYGIFEVAEGLDVGIGRIPARNLEQARIYVDKVIRYHSPEAQGAWRNTITLLGDDEDSDKHFYDSEDMADIISREAPVININKIYLDAFNQVSFGSGEKYPDVNDAVNNSFEKGHLLFNYLGHGGGSGMAHERVVTRPQIRDWSNKYALPLLITATCELSRYDDPSQDSPGELMLFDENGGSIGLISTTRLVLITLNTDLNRAVLEENLFKKDANGQYPTLGQAFSTATNNSFQAVNQRNFTYLGDPGIELAYPRYNVVTTKVNDSLIGSADIDTIKAYRKMKIDGEIRDLNGQVVSGFNGTVSPTVFDKPVQYSTLGNDPRSSVQPFNIQNSALYRGTVSVTDGKFFFEFVVPKDINYSYGQGKISYYAETSNTDATGFSDDIIIGGSAENEIQDTIPPEIDIYMDDTEFIFGGLTGESSILLANVFDENGVNTVGNGIGRDVTAVLDEDTENEEIHILNDFYQAKLNSYQEGEISYRLSDLETGRHTLRVKVWDVFNNSAEAYTEFVVAEDADLALDHVLNYPNPFTDHTTFHFDHNKSGRNLQVTVKIIAPSGRVVRTLYSEGIAAGGHFQQIDWDGRDQFGDNIGRGVYVYKVDVKSEDGTSAYEYQKLVILK